MKSQLFMLLLLPLFSPAQTGDSLEIKYKRKVWGKAIVKYKEALSYKQARCIRQ
jgi:hypothetical protein